MRGVHRVNCPPAVLPLGAGRAQIGRDGGLLAASETSRAPNHAGRIARLQHGALYVVGVSDAAKIELADRLFCFIESREAAAIIQIRSAKQSGGAPLRPIDKRGGGGTTRKLRHEAKRIYHAEQPPPRHLRVNAALTEARAEERPPPRG